MFFVLTICESVCICRHRIREAFMPVPSHMASWSDSWEPKISFKCLKLPKVSLRIQKEHIFVAFVNNRLRWLYVSRTILLIVSIVSNFSIDSFDCQRLLSIAPQVNFGSVAAFLELSAMLSIKTSVVLYKIYIDTMASFSSIPPLYRNVWLRHSRDVIQPGWRPFRHPRLDT